MRSLVSPPSSASAHQHVADHESAERLLRQARTGQERYEAVKAAACAGMPLDQIETYLERLDSTRALHQ
jgi:hypothetical protein